MAGLGQRFNATDHDTTQRDYEELPNGKYRLEIEASDVVPTNSGNGTILKTTMVVIEPEDYKGRKLFTTYNLENANVQAQEIGQRQFASLCRAMEIDSVDDSEELHFRAFVAQVGLGKPQYEKINGAVKKDANGNPIVKYPARAEIKKYFFPDEGNVPDPEIDANQPKPAPAAANDNRQQSRPAAGSAGRQQAAASGAGERKRPWGSK